MNWTTAHIIQHYSRKLALILAYTDEQAAELATDLAKLSASRLLASTKSVLTHDEQAILNECMDDATLEPSDPRILSLRQSINNTFTEAELADRAAKHFLGVLSEYITFMSDTMTAEQQEAASNLFREAVLSVQPQAK
jgi:hypothetical protein